jgi:hypothetical protein
MQRYWSGNTRQLAGIAIASPRRGRWSIALFAPDPSTQGPWDPDHGRLVLRLARPVFPESRPWTEASSSR